MNCKSCGLATQNAKFCCKLCYFMFRRKDLNRLCKNCGKKFLLKNIAYEKRGYGKHCSLSCGTRKFKFNESFFEKIDSEEKAYWLGFLYADGTQNGNQFQICLKIDDKEHLEKFRKTIDSNHSIKKIIKKNHKAGFAALFQISSKRFCKSLQDSGCVKNKTFIVKFPHLPDYLNRHFIRGVFDGDGTIGIMNKKYGYKKWSIYSASQDFCKSITNILTKENIDVVLYERRYKDNRKPGFNVEIHKQNEFPKLYNYLYKDASVYLQRKKNKFYSNVNQQPSL